MRKLYTANGRTFDSDSVYVHYCEHSDMTFITYESANKTEVVGFYYGEPCESDTEECIGRLVAEYDTEEEESDDR